MADNRVQTIVIKAEDVIADVTAPGPTGRVGLATAQAIVAALEDAGFKIGPAMARTATAFMPKAGDD